MLCLPYAGFFSLTSGFKFPLPFSSEYILIFCKQVRFTGEIFKIHVANGAFIDYNRESGCPALQLTILPRLIRCELSGEIEDELEIINCSSMVL